MKFKFIFTLLIMMLIAAFSIGCWENPTTKAIAYASGKTVGYQVDNEIPQADQDLSNLWNDFMASHNEALYIEPGEVMLLYTESFSIISLHAKDPYGIIGDLGVLLLLFGGSFEGDSIILKEPVPKSVLSFFQMGYVNGRRVSKQ